MAATQCHGDHSVSQSTEQAQSLTERQRYWQAHLQRCEAAGQTVRAYAIEHDLKVSTLYFYRKWLRSRREQLPATDIKKTRFVRAQVASATLPCRVHLRNGVTVELGVSGAELSSLLSSLNGLS